MRRSNWFEFKTKGKFVINTSKKTLIVLAAVVWVFGGIVLLFKGISLIKAAQIISPSITVILLVVIFAFIIGLIKSKYLMAKFCRKNLIRINKIDAPKIHQFFKPQFFFFLALMISAGIMLSEFAEGNYGFLLAVGGFDFSLSTALLTSSVVFFDTKLVEVK